MNWGWIGAAVGAAASVLFVPFTGGASLAALPKFALLAGIGAIGGSGVGAAVGKVTKTFGDTPKNELKQVGINPQKLHDEAKDYREKRQQFLDEKNKESKEIVKDKEKKLESLEESIKSLASEIKSLPDGPEKTQKQALLNKKKDQSKKLQAEIGDENKKIKEREDKIDKIFQDLGNPVNYTTEQYETKANSPRWKSWKNWGIGIGGILLLFVAIAFIRKLLNTLLSSLKN